MARLTNGTAVTPSVPLVDALGANETVLPTSVVDVVDGGDGAVLVLGRSCRRVDATSAICPTHASNSFDEMELSRSVSASLICSATSP